MWKRGGRRPPARPPAPLDGLSPRAPRPRSPSLTVSPTRAPASPGGSHLRVPPLRGGGRRLPWRVSGGAPGSSAHYLDGGPGSRGRRCADCGAGFPAVTAPPQPRSSLPLRVAPAFCFTRGTANAAAAMITTEPGGGGARSRRAPVRLREPRRRRPRPRGPGAPARARRPAARLRGRAARRVAVSIPSRSLSPAVPRGNCADD